MNSLQLFFAGIISIFLGVFGNVGTHTITEQQKESKKEVLLVVTEQRKGTSLVKELEGLLVYPCAHKEDAWQNDQCITIKQTLSAMDTVTLQKISDDYLVDKNNVYIIVYGVETEYITIIKDADPLTFSVFDKQHKYARDKNFVFVSEKKVEGVDPKTFHFLGYSKSNDAPYAVDSKKVYSISVSRKDNTILDLSEVSGADPKTFVP